MGDGAEPIVRPSRAAIRRARRARRRRRRVGIAFMLIGLVVAGIGVGLYVNDRPGGDDVVPDVRSETTEKTTTTPPLTTLAPATTIDPASPATTIPEPTVP